MWVTTVPALQTLHPLLHSNKLFTVTETSPNSKDLQKTSRNKHRINSLPCQAASPVTYLLSKMSEGLSSSQICEPVVYGTLRTSCHQPKVILLIDLGFPSPRVRQGVAPQLFCNNTAKVWADLEEKGKKKKKQDWLHFRGERPDQCV